MSGHHAAKIVVPMLPSVFPRISTRISTHVCNKSFPRVFIRQQHGSSCSRILSPLSCKPLHCTRSLSDVQHSSLHTTAVIAAKKGKKGKGSKGGINTNTSVDPSILNLEEVKQDMKKAVDILQQEYIKTLSIRTSQGSLDHIQVSTPDGKFPLNHLAQIVTKSNSMMVVNMSNFPQATDAAVTALRESGMNLSPQVDGHTIQVPVPKVTKDHRENLAKTAKKMCNDTKLSIRNVRQKYMTNIKKRKDGTSKDTIFQLEKQIQQITDDTNGSAEQLLAAKTKELLGK